MKEYARLESSPVCVRQLADRQAEISGKHREIFQILDSFSVVKFLTLPK
jgi:hypothetical protein